MDTLQLETLAFGSKTCDNGRGCEREHEMAWRPHTNDICREWNIAIYNLQLYKYEWVCDIILYYIIRVGNVNVWKNINYDDDLVKWHFIYYGQPACRPSQPHSRSL